LREDHAAPPEELTRVRWGVLGVRRGTNVVPNVRNIKASMHTTQILLGPALATLLMAVGMTSSASTFNDRRVIVAYGSPGSAALDELQQLIDTRRCELLDRDVDVHIVDAKEIAMLASIEGTPPAQSPTKSRTEARVACGNGTSDLHEQYVCRSHGCCPGPNRDSYPGQLSKCRHLHVDNQLFISVLAIHGYTAVPAGSLTKIVPTTVGLQSGPVPLVTGRLDDEELVTEVVQLRTLVAQEVADALRPLLSASASISAESMSNSIVITDHATNIERLLELISEMQ